MRKIVYSLIGLFVLGLLVVGNSFSNEMTMSEEMTGTTPATMGWNTCKASDLIGATIEDPLGLVVVGHINDLAINPSTGKIDSVLVNEIRGIGATEIAVPFSEIARVSPYSYVYLRSGMRFEHELPYAAYHLLELPPMPQGDYRFTKLLGADVEGQEGQNVARINDFIIDSDGRVIYAVFFDVGGTDTRFAAVPFEALSPKGENLFALHITSEQVLASPAFDWSDAGSMHYAQDVYRHYGLQPYWETQ